MKDWLLHETKSGPRWCVIVFIAACAYALFLA